MEKGIVHPSAIITPSTIFEGDHLIGPYSIIGNTLNQKAEATKLGNNIEIGSFCVIENGVSIGVNCRIDHYSVVYSNVTIGNNVQILYGAKIFDQARIGDNCIICGDIPERVIIEDDVTFIGMIAHSYRDPTIHWDEATEKSPTIKKGSVIGLKALLIGGIVVGENCYVAAGEILKFNLPDNSVFIGGKIIPLQYFRGFIKTRNHQK